MNEQIKKQIKYKIQHSKHNRMSNIKGCKIKLKVTDTVDFYKNILYDRFKCNYQDKFYFVIDRTIQWYNKWYFDFNDLQYDEYENKIRFQMYKKQINLQQIYLIYLQQKSKYNLNIELSKQLILNYLSQCYKKTTGYQNFI